MSLFLAHKAKIMKDCSLRATTFASNKYRKSNKEKKLKNNIKNEAKKIKSDNFTEKNIRKLESTIFFLVFWVHRYYLRQLYLEFQGENNYLLYLIFMQLYINDIVSKILKFSFICQTDYKKKTL